MTGNRVDAVLTDAQVEEAKTHVRAVAATFPFAVALTDDERRALPKLGDKSLAFVEKALEAAKAKPKLIPEAVRVDAFERDLVLYKQAGEVARSLAAVTRSVEDTQMVAGSEAFQAALIVYGFLQSASGLEPGLQEVVRELGARFRRQRPTAAGESGPGPTK
ncbi:MAG: hypothetical protein MUF54_12145 [Polyangiaceae bacterium]|jgi:hypothetical protein|nr:hypothetical protein [Polyangiaceae bacterium]